jgi:hypothetical protein
MQKMNRLPYKYKRFFQIIHWQKAFIGFKYYVTISHETACSYMDMVNFATSFMQYWYVGVYKVKWGYEDERKQAYNN